MMRSTFEKYIPALKQILADNPDRIQIISGHDGVSFQKYRNT